MNICIKKRESFLLSLNQAQIVKLYSSFVLTVVKDDELVHLTVVKDDELVYEDGREQLGRHRGAGAWPIHYPGL